MLSTERAKGTFVSEEQKGRKGEEGWSLSTVGQKSQLKFIDVPQEYTDGKKNAKKS